MRLSTLCSILSALIIFGAGCGAAPSTPAAVAEPTTTPSTSPAAPTIPTTSLPTTTPEPPPLPTSSPTSTQQPATIKPPQDAGAMMVRDITHQFGEKLQTVSLTSSTSVRNEQLQTAFGDLVTANLLKQWKERSTNVPGKKTSSPWPDHIDISSVIPRSPTRYEVTGYIIYLTSDQALQGGETRREPITVTLEQTGTTWNIVAVETKLTNNERLATTYQQPKQFEITYPTAFIIDGTPTNGLLFDSGLRTFSVNGLFADAKNNFNGAWITVSATTSLKKPGSCTSFSDLTYIKPDMIRQQKINGIIFSTVTTSDAGMSQYHDTQAYRTVHNNTCYEIALVVHTTNAEVYSPRRQAFDTRKAFTYLEKILATFRFLP